MEQTNDRIGMPWAVRIALGWFILLAIACCAPFVFWLCPLLLSGDVQEALWNLVPCVGLMALGGGFVGAIICGRRIWVTDKDEHLELKRIDGSAPMDFDDKFMVVVRKGGAVQILKRKYAIRRHVLGDAPYRLGKDTCFLTPAGKRNSLAASGESENAQRCR